MVHYAYYWFDSRINRCGDVGGFSALDGISHHVDADALFGGGLGHDGDFTLGDTHPGGAIRHTGSFAELFQSEHWRVDLDCNLCHDWPLWLWLLAIVRSCTHTHVLPVICC